MPKQEFQATQGLLEDDMRRQAGSIEKSWLEAVMNSVDAGATEFTITIGENETVIIDNGSGMSEEDIEMYFRNFGLKDDDVEEKVFGQFRRGRGQLFNFGRNLWHTQDNILVVDLDHDEARFPKEDVPVDLDNSDEDVWVEDDQVVFNTEGLGFNQQPSTEFIDGTEITIEHYSSIEHPEAKADDFRKLAKYIPWLHEINLYVNNEPLENGFAPDFETEYAYYQFEADSHGTNASVYNLGAFVDSIPIKDSKSKKVPLDAVVVTKHELTLNNARTDIIGGCSTWKQVKEDHVVGAQNYLASAQDLKTSQVKWLIRQSADNDQLFDQIKDRELIEDIKGGKTSLSELQSTTFAFAPESNAVAEEAMERKGIVMLNDKYENAFKQVATEQAEGSNEIPEGKSYEEVIDDEMEFEMKRWDESKLSKRRKQNLDKIRWFLREVGCYDDVYAGHSNHVNVWRTDPDTILVDRNFLNANKNKFITHVLDKVVEIAAADQDTRGGFDKGFSYNRSYRRMMQKSTQPRQDLITGNFNISQHPVLE